MTVSYNVDVSSVSIFNFFKILFRWRGSVWKSVWLELLIWLCGYYIVFTTYRYVLNSDAQRKFNEIVKPIGDRLDQCVPLTFMLAFFVTIIVDRWKNIFANMGFIENVALAITALVRGNEPNVVMARRTIIRYLVLSQVLVFRDISLKVRRRFPNPDSIVKAGFLQEHELAIIEDVNCPYNKYWVPINWATTILHKLFKDGKISAAPLYNSAWQEIKAFRSNIALLCNFDWVPIPLAYPQVIFVAVRFYFFMCLFSRQHLDEKTSSIDVYFPLLTVFQFIFYMGWLKVAEGLLNPLGEDDDDFECNFLIDKNIATGMAIVDQTYDKMPEMRVDKFAEPSFAPFYPEDVIQTGTDHALVGSAQTVELANATDDIDMKMIDINSPLVKGTSTGKSTFRKLGKAFSRRHRSNSVQPRRVKLGPEPAFSKSLAPQRPYGAFELSNGFSSNIQMTQQSQHMPKLEEEDGLSDRSDKTHDNEPEPQTPILPFDTPIGGNLKF